MIDVGFTGTQKGMNSIQKGAFRITINQILKDTEDRLVYLHHGDCFGADEDAHHLAFALGCRIVIHPPLDEKKRAFCKEAFKTYPAKSYLDRDREIVDFSSRLIATPKEQEESIRSGTWYTIRQARRLNRRHTILFPDGSIFDKVS